MKRPFLTYLVWAGLAFTVSSRINRRQVIKNFNPVRHASSNSTPIQVGNGNFAFGVDVTGLQTFQPYATLSSWGWHNFSLPTTPGQTSPDDFAGLDWWTHGRLVNYDQPNPAQPDISNWLIMNPQRINLARIGFLFDGSETTITESDLSDKLQTLDLYSGAVVSQFKVYEETVYVKVHGDPNSDTVAIQVESQLVSNGKLSVFIDYPYPDVNKFDDPFVGVLNASASLHTTELKQSSQRAQITHKIDDNSYVTSIHWGGEASVSGPQASTHRYFMEAKRGSSKLEFTVNFSPTPERDVYDVQTIAGSSAKWWELYWESGGFVDLTATDEADATELQRRILLSQYNLAVNEAGKDSPQESGLVNNGWYGKFHMEMVFWHLGHWARWGKWYMLDRTLPGLYERFLPTSKQRAQDQGYAGARWGKMSDPTGRSAPGEINSLLIWQQPHPFYFAEMEYKAFPNKQTLEKWDEILTESVEFMASFAWWNASTGVYDLGPPMYVVSENTAPNVTINPTFELAYWRFGLNIAVEWKQRQNRAFPESWQHVAQNLAPLPIFNETYATYEGIPDMWVDPTTFQDHPAMTGIYGLLPATPGFNLTIMRNTAAKIATIWDFPYSYGWDFPMLAMNAARLGEIEQAVGYLLNENFQFDDIGMPVGGSRVPTPYFPGASSMLSAVAMLAGGWEESPGPKWPEGWVVKVEGFETAL